MLRPLSLCLSLFFFVCAPAFAQRASSAYPPDLLIARHTYFDMGPPSDFYEVIHVTTQPSGLFIDRALVTPEGVKCIQPPTVDVKTALIHEEMGELLREKNPCDIPEKDLKREIERCKNCLNFSGVNVTLYVTCGTKKRALRMDILDRDLFDARPHTPGNTSWTMSVMNSLDKQLGPGVMEKPIFNLESTDKPQPEVTGSTLLGDVRAGKYDSLFHSDSSLSKMAEEAQRPPVLPTASLVKISPETPISMGVAKYPPIARAAHVEGDVSLSFDVSPDGQTGNFIFADRKTALLQGAVKDALSGWVFPKSANGYKENATFSFRLNCPASMPSP